MQLFHKFSSCKFFKNVIQNSLKMAKRQANQNEKSIIPPFHSSRERFTSKNKLYSYFRFYGSLSNNQSTFLILLAILFHFFVPLFHFTRKSDEQKFVERKKGWLVSDGCGKLPVWELYRYIWIHKWLHGFMASWHDGFLDKCIVNYSLEIYVWVRGWLWVDFLGINLM